MAQNFAIRMPLKHMLGVLRVAEIVEGDFCCAMECIDKETAVCFLFTKVNNFQFNIGVAQVFFENKDQDLIGADKVTGVMSGAPQRMLREPEAASTSLNVVPAPDSTIKNEVKQSTSVQKGIDDRDMEAAVESDEEMKQQESGGAPVEEDCEVAAAADSEDEER